MIRKKGNEYRKKEIYNRIKEWILCKDSGPYQVEINPTNRCNLACLPCFSRGKALFKPDEELSKEKYMEIINQASRLNVKEWMITGGGEPLCKPELTISIMNEIRKNDMNGSLSTNGTLFKKDMIEDIIDMGWKKIQISINGPDKGTDEKLRGENAFEKTVENIKTFNDIKKEKNLHFPEIHIMPILTSKNFNKLTDFVNFCDEVDADFLRIQPYMSELLPRKQPGSEKERKKISESLEITEENHDKLLREIRKSKKLAANKGIQNNLHRIEETYTDNVSEKLEIKESSKKEYELEKSKSKTCDVDKNDDLLELLSKNIKGKKISSFRCFFPWYILHIDAEGNLTPCAQKPKMGKNIKNNSLDEIWLGEEFENLREQIATDNMMGECKYCCPIMHNDNSEFKNYVEKKKSELKIPARMLESWNQRIETTKINKDVLKVLGNQEKELIRLYSKNLNNVPKKLSEIEIDKLPTYGEPIIDIRSFKKPKDLDSGDFENIRTLKKNDKKYITPVKNRTGIYKKRFNNLPIKKLKYIMITYKKYKKEVNESFDLQIFVNPTGVDDGDEDKWKKLGIKLNKRHTGGKKENIGIKISDYGIYLEENNILESRIFFKCKEGKPPEMHRLRIYGE